MRKIICCVLAVAGMLVLVAAASVVKLKGSQATGSPSGEDSQGQAVESAAGNLPILTVDTAGAQIAKEAPMFSEKIPGYILPTPTAAAT